MTNFAQSNTVRQFSLVYKSARQQDPERNFRGLSKYESAAQHSGIDHIVGTRSSARVSHASDSLNNLTRENFFADVLLTAALSPESLHASRNNRTVSFDDIFIKSRIEKLSSSYHISQANGTISYLRSHPKVLDILDQAIRHIKNSFGETDFPNVELFLDEGVQRLFITVPISASVEVNDARNMLKSLNMSWWSGARSGIKEHIYFDLDYL